MNLSQEVVVAARATASLRTRVLAVLDELERATDDALLALTHDHRKNWRK